MDVKFTNCSKIPVAIFVSSTVTSKPTGSVTEFTVTLNPSIIFGSRFMSGSIILILASF